ncbi:MAG TPA: hypothetical protein VIE68_06040 [Gemmatimonadota bacterium]
MRQIVSRWFPLFASIAVACSSDSFTGPVGVSPRGLGLTAANGPIVFLGRDGIEVMNADGSNRHVVRATASEGPDWSPDGTRIAFSEQGQIWMMDADGSDVTQLTAAGNTHPSTEPAWSPDGTKIAYRRTETSGGTGHIWVLEVDGSGETQITSGPDDGFPDDFSPTWSPDGTQIAFRRTQRNASTLTYQDIYTVGIGGGAAVDITNTTDPAEDERDPDWSVDGKIVFTCAPQPGDLGTDLCVIDGGARTRIIDTSPAFEFDPSWSPDGTKIVFARVPMQGGSGRIWSANANGTGETELTNQVGFDQEPSWGTVAGAPAAECEDGSDNDDDGKVDFPADPGCTNAGDDDETDPPPLSQCKNGIDDDSDGKVDFPADPGCETANDDAESPDPPPMAVCSDGIDNDGDGRTDFPGDPGCASPVDTDESNPPGVVFEPSVCLGLTTSEGVRSFFAFGETWFIGTDGDDVIVGTDGNDAVAGEAGHDLICTGAGNDVVEGGPGDDTVFGGPGREFINGRTGNDYLWGEGDSDFLIGYLGRDTCIGGPGLNIVLCDFQPEE